LFRICGADDDTGGSLEVEAEVPSTDDAISATSIAASPNPISKCEFIMMKVEVKMNAVAATATAVRQSQERRSSQNTVVCIDG
jgi:hypothetical protein